MFAEPKIVLSAALVLALCGTVMASDSGENHQDNANATGPNPFMTFSGPDRSFGREAFARHPMQHEVVNHHAKK
jgi:hypothetical protein